MEVQFQNLSKKYKGKYALRDFSATLENGVYDDAGDSRQDESREIHGIVERPHGRRFVLIQSVGDGGIFRQIQHGGVRVHPAAHESEQEHDADEGQRLRDHDAEKHGGDPRAVHERGLAVFPAHAVPEPAHDDEVRAQPRRCADEKERGIEQVQIAV